MYTPGASTGKINDARYNLFCAKNCLESNPIIPSPNGNGWKLDTTNGKEDLAIDLMEGKPAPEAVLELLACKCARSCKLLQCVCLSNGLKCTDLCKLKDCDNQPRELDEVEQEEDDYE